MKIQTNFSNDQCLRYNIAKGKQNDVCVVWYAAGVPHVCVGCRTGHDTFLCFSYDSMPDGLVVLTNM
jgi:hypothetical protein